MACLENLKKRKPFTKGDPRCNRKGAPKKFDIVKAIEENCDINEIVQMLYKQANKGNVLAIREILDRYFGKSKQAVDVTTDGEKIQILPIEKNV